MKGFRIMYNRVNRFCDETGCFDVDCFLPVKDNEAAIKIVENVFYNELNDAVMKAVSTDTETFKPELMKYLAVNLHVEYRNDDSSLYIVVGVSDYNEKLFEILDKDSALDYPDECTDKLGDVIEIFLKENDAMIVEKIIDEFVNKDIDIDEDEVEDEEEHNRNIDNFNIVNVDPDILQFLKEGLK